MESKPEYDRFDFEQAIMQCWGMVDDLKAFRKAGASPDVYDALAVVYQQHFTHLWDIFEYLLQEGKLT